jgi:cation diffusion facilitator CzcD-associated flavoprotein CzcO
MSADARLGELDNRPLKSRKVAVIGAGAAGLAAAKELLREGHAVTVFEQNSRVGGLWVYDPDREEEDLLGANPTRKRVHSSVYASLRTNLMREVMGFTDFPFLPTGLDGRDDRRFPGHAEVAAYLQDFALCFGLLDVIQLCTAVEHVGFCKRGGVESGGESGGEMVWTVRTRRTDVSDGGVSEAEFDAVVVCNGHYAEPRLADSPGKLLGCSLESSI